MKIKNLTKNKIGQILSGTLFLIAVFFLCIFLPQVSYAADKGYVDAEDLNVRTKPSTKNSEIVGTLSYEDVTILGSEKDSSGNLWYKIRYNGGSYYVSATYVTIKKDTKTTDTKTTDTKTTDTSSQTDDEQPVSYGSFKKQLKAFPVSYRKLIREIHAVYPNYIFEANNIDMTYDDVVYEQTLDHRKTVSMDYDGVSWRSLSSDCYDWKTKTWGTYSGNWTDAGIDVIEYYIDPRNFLTTRNMYIFAKQTYTGSESISGVQNITAGSFLAGNYTDRTGTHSYIDTIMKVAKVSKVSPYVIAATLRQEQPTSGDSALIDGSRKYYNFFNFGASGSDVIGNGIAYAKKQGWNTVYKSILGGAQSYYNGYLKYGQDTYYYKDFNSICMDFDHQYAQGVYDQIGSGLFLKNALGDDTQATLILRIPVYKDMAAEAPGYPPETNKLNARYKKGGAVIPRKQAAITDGSGTSSGSSSSGSGNLTTQIGTTSGTSSGTTGTSGKTGSSGTGSSSGQNTTSGKSSTNNKSSPKYRTGDANGDGKLTALDYVAVKNHILKKRVIKDKDLLIAADVTKDGKITKADYVKLKRAILKKSK